MIGLLTAYDSDDDSEKSPEASSPRPSSPPQGSPRVPELASATITVNTSVTVVVRKTIQRQPTNSLIGNYGSDSDEDESGPTHFASTDGVIDIIASPKPTKTLKNATGLRLMRLLPPEPLGQPDRDIQDKISGYLKMGQSYNARLQGMKNFHNPYILNKIAEKYGINQTASNYPPEIYDPLEWEREDYERIARRQEHVMKEKVQQEDAKQFVIPAVPLLASSSSSNVPGLRRWDSQPPAKKSKSAAQQIQHAVQVANQLKASLSSGAIDAAAAAKKEAVARAAVLASSVKKL